jgi:hypothetical protein
MHRRSPGALAGGIVMVSVGPLVMLVGALLAGAARPNCSARFTTDHILSDTGGYEQCVSDRKTTAYIVAIGGGSLVGGGIPLIIYGAKKVPSAPAPTALFIPWLASGTAGLSVQLHL